MKDICNVSFQDGKKNRRRKDEEKEMEKKALYHRRDWTVLPDV